MKIKKIIKIIKNPKKILIYTFNKNLYKFFKDKIFLKLKYKLVMNKELDLENPKTFNEKLQWLKLYDRNPEYTKMVDKYEAKQYVASIIGEEYIIPTLGIYDKFDDIDFSKLPNEFVMKPTHDSGTVIVCKDKSKLDIKECRKKINKALKRNYYYVHREWPYKNVKPRIIIEKYIVDENNELLDYKFSCFNGYVDNVMVCIDRKINDTKFYFFNRNWELLRINKRGIEAPVNFQLPKVKNMEKMFRITEKLSKDLKYNRIDLYNVDGKIYFGEFTFFPQAGFEINLTKDADKYMGDLIKLEGR